MNAIVLLNKESNRKLIIKYENIKSTDVSVLVNQVLFSIN